MAIGLFVARFQPLHKGHERAIKKALKLYEKVIVVIGSANKSREEKNPFTAEERKLMLEAVFSKEINEGKIEVLVIEDKDSDEEWANEIINRVNFDEVYTASDWVAKAFEGKKSVKRFKPFKYETINGTNIRRLIKEGNEEWKKYVNRKVVEIIQKIAVKEFFSKLSP
ncbi:MAG: adenylyltransferase/cytidyltransferase family protein [Candidatus Aenigmatarchaeota archaeon]|nr:adenylyltransferase/cytidyltransferase family protein [Candidatus Aenigmarchaeota archaeon]